MKTKLILAGIAALAFTASLAAHAADLGPPPYKAPAYVEPVAANWTGLYVGINGGYGFGSSDWDFPAVSPEVGGGVVGGTLGYNFQGGPWLFGLEADIDWAGLTGTATCSVINCQTKSDWLGTARARLGYAGWGGLLAYITGGAAFGDVQAQNDLFGVTASSTQTGWTAGGGLEYAFGYHWSGKVEYLYADLGSFDCGLAACGVSPDNVSLQLNLIRAGLNYRF